MEAKAGPLSGIRILDAATFLAAPYAASQLSEYGAEVIKIEQPSGDPMREIPPFRGDVSRVVEGHRPQPPERHARSEHRRGPRRSSSSSSASATSSS